MNKAQWITQLRQEHLQASASIIHPSLATFYRSQSVPATPTAVVTDAGCSPPETEQPATTFTMSSPRQGRLPSQRMSDERMQQELAASLERLPADEQAGITQLWSQFATAGTDRRRLILGGLLRQCELAQLSYLSQQLDPLLRIDFITNLPTEIAFKILRHLDARSLCCAAQVSPVWRERADSDAVWRRICEQHIDRKCTKCGWGLPLLDQSRQQRRRRCKEDMVVQEQAERLRNSQRCDDSQSAYTNGTDGAPLMDHDGQPIHAGQHYLTEDDAQPRSKRMRMSPSQSPPRQDRMVGSSGVLSTATTDAVNYRNRDQSTHQPIYRRPWKEVYAERAIIERNWRCGQYTSRVLKGHTDGVMCLQFDDTYLCSGGYDSTVRVWCIKTGRCLRLLKGHTRCVRALTFDDVKLVTASMDRTIRVWNYRTGECMRILEGHTDGVVCVSANRTILVSGGADATVKVWNFEQGSCHTLRGHTDWVNTVKLYRNRWVLSGSDDTTVRLWDLRTFACVRIFQAHVGQVQSLSITPSIISDEEFVAWLALSPEEMIAAGDAAAISAPTVVAAEQTSLNGATPTSVATQKSAMISSASAATTATATANIDPTHAPKLITGALDNTLRLFNLRTGECLRTFFGHVEGVWCLAVDSLRIVSGAHDKTLRIWDQNTGQCVHALVGHRGAVTCVGLSDTRAVTGSDDCEIRIWDFSPQDS